jgi:hypothetical protein
MRKKISKGYPIFKLMLTPKQIMKCLDGPPPPATQGARNSHTISPVQQKLLVIASSL